MAERFDHVMWRAGQAADGGDVSRVRHVTRRRVAFAIATIAAVLTLASVMVTIAGSALAQSNAMTGAGYLTPFPDKDTYRIQIIGDVMADGIHDGLVQGLSDDARVLIEDGVKRVDYLTRLSWEEVLGALDVRSGQQASNVAVVLFGINDRQPVRMAGQRRLGLGTEAWREEYGQRIDRLMKALRGKGAAVYWIGLPTMRRDEQNEYAQEVNAIIRDRSFRNGIKYIDAFGGFQTASGEYSAYGPDEDGEDTLLRTRDGVYFTDEGYRKLAHFVEREIKRDIAEAVSQRNVPLLGTEAELRRLLPQPVQTANASDQQANVRPTYAGRSGGTAPASPSADKTRPSPTGEQGARERMADNSRVTLKRVVDGREETMTLDIVRPALSASVLALVARTSPRASRLGDTVQGRTLDGMPVLASVTPAEPSKANRLTPSQAPMFRLWGRGERTPPRAGRVDDFAWPSGAPQESPVAPGNAPRPASVDRRPN